MGLGRGASNLLLNLCMLRQHVKPRGAHRTEVAVGLSWLKVHEAPGLDAALLYISNLQNI